MALSITSHAALCGDWKLTDRFNTSVVLSDNIDRNDRKDAGTSLNIRPNLMLVGQGGRVSGAVAYSPSLSVRLGGEASSGLSHFLNATVASELYENTLFVNARASAGLTSRSGTSTVGLDGVSHSSSSSDSSQTFTFAVSPELRNRFGTFADSRLRLNADTVQNSESSSDSNGYGLSYTLNSGRQFPGLPWTLLFDYDQTEHRDRTDERMQALGQYDFRVNNTWLFRANAGAEKNNVTTTRSDTDGFIWGLGSTWTPSGRTNLTVDYSQRYSGANWSAQFSHVTRRTRITGAYTRTVSNARQDQLDSTFDPIPGLDDTPFISIPGTDDLITTIPTVSGIDDTNDYLLDRLSFGLDLTGLRSSVSGQFVWSKRDYESGSTPNTDTYNIRTIVSRQLDQYFSVNGSFDWQRVETASSSDRDRYQLAIGINRSLGRKSSVGLRYSFLDDSDSPAENRLYAIFSTSFL